MKQGQPLRAELAAVARQLHANGWVANHDGNVTARDGAVFVGTQTATSKRLITDRALITIDAKGQVVGSGKAFGELGLHLTVYQRRPDVHAVVHAHPPHATAISAARVNPIETPFIAEALVSLGPKIPRLAYAHPGDAARAVLAPWCELVDGVLLGNHGVLTWGTDLEQAYLRMEVIEHLAKIAIAAAPLGGVEPLPADAIPPLLAARAKANIGRAADRAVETASQLLTPSGPARVMPVVACAPAPHSTTPTISHSGSRTADLADLVREEIVNALRSR
ncbi:MAG: class II aldolase/adducin family protein [Deltaproteobacteria bacterium]|nr:class II aldolase/adducin family protein [Deltaproteobacteria bacterium]